MNYPWQPPMTLDTMTPITLYGRTYNPVDGVVHIPLKDGTEATVSISSEGRKRKDWVYITTHHGGTHTTVTFAHLLSALALIFTEGDLA